MRVYVVAANVMDRDEYRDYTLKPVDRWHPYFTMGRDWLTNTAST